MNTLSFFVLISIGAAIAIVMLAWKYLKWQAIIWLGVLFATTAGVALFLDQLTDIVASVDVGERTATGIPLFMLGPEISILGMGWPFVFIAFLCGVALFVLALVKRTKEPPAAPVEPVEEDISEIARIENDLKKDIDDVELDDPAERGEKDATSVGGPLPSRSAVEPEGYELVARNVYETLGSAFVQRTIARLKEEIAAALATLTRIKTELDQQPYETIATGDYNQHTANINDQKIDRMRTEVTTTDQQYQDFVKQLKLKPGEKPAWSVKRTSLKQLIFIGLVFALFEFAVSWYFLKSQIGRAPAIEAAALAVSVIGLLAFGAAALFQFMRRGETPPIRALASAAYTSLLFLVFCAFGLLLNFRDVLAKENIVGQFDAILDGYTSMFAHLNNLTLFLINLFALAFFYWKTLVYFDRFHGYQSVKQPSIDAQKAWDKLFTDDNDTIREALDHASDRADDHVDTANESFNDLQEKKTALESIRSLIDPMFVKHLHKAYRDDIKEYRDNNRQRRNYKVHPIPKYFNRDAEFCKLEEHFADVHRIDTFLGEHAKPIESAAGDRHHIQQAGLKWQNERSELQAKLAREFQRKINDSG